MKKRLVSRHRFALCTFFYGIYILGLPLLLFVCAEAIIIEKMYFGGAIFIFILLGGAVVLVREYLRTVTVFYSFSSEGVIITSPEKKKIFKWDDFNYCGAVTAAWDSRDAHCVYIYLSKNYISEKTLYSFDKIRKRDDIFWFLYNDEAFIELMNFIPPQWQELLRMEFEREKRELRSFSSLRFKLYK